MYRLGLDHYLNGSWDLAKECLRKADDMMVNSNSDSDGGGDSDGHSGNGNGSGSSNGNVDGNRTSRTLLAYMRGRDWKCPSDWNGY